MKGLPTDRAEHEGTRGAFAKCLAEIVSILLLREDHGFFATRTVGDVIHGLHGQLKEQPIVSVKDFLLHERGDLRRRQFDVTRRIDRTSDGFHLSLVYERIQVGLNA